MMAEFEVEYTDVYDAWWDGLSKSEREAVSGSVGLLMQRGPHLPFPHSSGVYGSRYSHMRELRVQHRGRPYRVLYAFDPRRIAILLIGGDKTGDGRWYDRFLPVADALYDQHLFSIRAADAARQP
ncbi:type II toxin-antitoxin system RelE/ParE family toxin [Longimicrobium terrae]|nr:addiction module toxin RelE [Longimicrobium terrae]